MFRYVKLLLAALVVASVLGVDVGGAAGNALSVSEKRFRIVWTALEFRAAESTVRCAVTFEGSFHSRTLAKTANALAGHITRAAVASTCTGGTARTLTETLPWHVQYASFAGTLPTISSVTLRTVGAGFSVFPSGLTTCLARTTEASPGRFTVNLSGGTVTGITALSEAGIPLSGGFLCEIAGEGHLGGTGTATVLGSTTQLRVTLSAAPTASVGVERTEGVNILVFVRNTTPPGGPEITSNEIIKGPPNPGRYTLFKEGCAPKVLVPQQRCVFTVVRNEGGGSTLIEVETTVGVKTVLVE